MTEITKITEMLIERTARDYVVHYPNESGDYVEQLFGCRTLPTAFLAICEPAVVLASIRALNPGVAVHATPWPRQRAQSSATSSIRCDRARPTNTEYAEQECETCAQMDLEVLP